MQDFSICKLNILLDSTNNMEIWDSLFRSGNQLVLRILDILYACLPSRSLKCVPRQSNSSQRRRSWMEVHSEWWTHSLFESVTSLFAWEQAKSVSYLAWELGCPKDPSWMLFWLRFPVYVFLSAILSVMILRKKYNHQVLAWFLLPGICSKFFSWCALQVMYNS